MSGHLPPSEAADQQVLTARPSSLAPGAAPAPRGEPGEPGLGQERAGQDTADQQHARPPDNTTLLLFLASVLIPNIKCRQPTSSLSSSCHSSHCWLMHSLSSCVVQCFFLAYPAPEHHHLLRLITILQAAARRMVSMQIATASDCSLIFISCHKNFES